MPGAPIEISGTDLAGNDEHDDGKYDRSDRAVDEIQRPVNTRHGAAQLHLHDIAQHHAQNDRYDRLVETTQNDTQNTERRCDDTVVDGVAKGIDADKPEQEDEDPKKARRDLQHLQKQVRRAQQEQEHNDVDGEQRDIERHHEIHVTLEQLRAGNDIVNIEDGQHHGRQRFARNAKGEKGNGCRNGNRVVGGFRCNQPFRRTLAKRFWGFGCPAGIGVGQELRGEFSNAGHDAHDGAAPGGNGGNPLVPQYLSQTAKERALDWFGPKILVLIDQQDKGLTEGKEPGRHDNQINARDQP